MTTVNRQELVAALRAIRVAAGGLKSLPVLENVAIEVVDDQLQLTGTNLDIYVRRLVPFTGDPISATTVHAQKFGEFSQRFAGDKVALKLEDAKLRVTSGKQRATLGTVKVEDFPSWPSIDSATSFTLSREEFDAVVKRVATFASPASDKGRPILTGVHIKGEGGKIRFEAADNYRVGIMQVEHDATLDVVIPAITLQAVAKAVEGDSINITVSSNGAMFSGSKGVLMSRLIDGQFPNVDPVLPTDFKRTLLVDPDDLADTAKLAELASEANIISGEAVDDGLRLHSKDFDTEFDTTVDATLSVGDDTIKFAINTRFLGAIASVFGNSPLVELGWNSPLAPLSFSDPKDSSFRAVVMPVRTNS